MAESKDKKTQTPKMPVLFIGHGSPMNIISQNSYTESLVKLANELPLPRAIMVVSAHWLTDGTQVGCMPKPRTIHDFYGFPDELYRIRYASPGSPECAELVSKLVHSVQIKCDMGWGLDHASWAVLKHMYPKADIPVFEMSLHYSFNEWHPLPLTYHYNLASEMSELRRNGILIIGSGNIVHNLGLIDFDDTNARPYDWAVEFDEKVKANLISHNHEELINFQKIGQSSRLSVPTLDHYLPMIYAIALQEKNEPLTFTHEGFQNGSVSMRGFRIG